MIDFIKSLFESERERERRQTEAWLSNSESLEEVERKQKALNRGEAPWQVQANVNLRGWV